MSEKECPKCGLMRAAWDHREKACPSCGAPPGAKPVPAEDEVTPPHARVFSLVNIVLASLLVVCLVGVGLKWAVASRADGATAVTADGARGEHSVTGAAEASAAKATLQPTERRKSLWELQRESRRLIVKPPVVRKKPG